MSAPVILHVRRARGLVYKYVGRKTGQQFHFGNPFSHLARVDLIMCEDREQACNLFELWIAGKAHTNLEPQRRKWILDKIDSLRGKNLGCYCAPKRCHAETLLRLANE